jgi:hypothetical protein
MPFLVQWCTTLYHGAPGVDNNRDDHHDTVIVMVIMKLMDGMSNADPHGPKGERAACGVFGSPPFFVRDQTFFGNDRLDFVRVGGNLRRNR